MDTVGRVHEAGQTPGSFWGLGAMALTILGLTFVRPAATFWDDVVKVAAGVMAWVAVEELVYRYAGRLGNRVAKARAEWGPQLTQWLALPSVQLVTDEDLLAWLGAMKAGVTPEQANAWARRRLPPEVAWAAKIEHVSEEKVDELANLMRETGMWDGRDRRKIANILGWYDNTRFIALGEWVQHPWTSGGPFSRKPLSAAAPCPTFSKTYATTPSITPSGTRTALDDRPGYDRFGAVLPANEDCRVGSLAYDQSSPLGKLAIGGVRPFAERVSEPGGTAPHRTPHAGGPQFSTDQGSGKRRRPSVLPRTGQPGSPCVRARFSEAITASLPTTQAAARSPRSSTASDASPSSRRYMSRKAYLIAGITAAASRRRIASSTSLG